MKLSGAGCTFWSAAASSNRGVAAGRAVSAGADIAGGFFDHSCEQGTQVNT